MPRQLPRPPFSRAIPPPGSNRMLEDKALPLLDDALSRLQAEFPKYKFIRQYDNFRGFVLIAMRVLGSGGPCLVMTEDENEMRELLVGSLADDAS